MEATTVQLDFLFHVSASDDKLHVKCRLAFPHLIFFLYGIVLLKDAVNLKSA